MVTYLILIRPYKSPLSKVLSITNELLLAGMVMGSFRFVNPVITPDQSKQIGLVLIIVLILTIIINWTGIIIYGVVQFIKKRMRANRLKRFKTFKNSKKKKKPSKFFEVNIL